MAKILQADLRDFVDVPILGKVIAGGISYWKYSMTSVFKIFPISASINAYDVLYLNFKDIWNWNMLLPKIWIFVIRMFTFEFYN